MKQNHHQHNPAYKTLGRYLKTMRQRLQESLGETSGAVEIDVEQLDRFERGTELPNEDILMLLISHFNLQEDEAVKVWEMAGYEQPEQERADESDRDRQGEEIMDDNQLRQTMHVMLLALDNRVLYSNGVEIVTDQAGVVLNFTQGDMGGQQGSQQPYAVSRVGMSYEQAEQLLLTLQRAMLHRRYLSGPKQLPPPSSEQQNS